MNELKSRLERICQLLEQGFFDFQSNNMAKVKSIMTIILGLVKSILSEQLPSPCTPKQYKEITGKDWPDGCLVWINGEPCNYYYVKCHAKPGTITIVQTGQPAPPADWRPE